MTWKLKSPKGVEGVFPNLGCSGSVPELQLPSNSFPAACSTDVSRCVSRVVPFVWMCAFCCLTCWLCVSVSALRDWAVHRQANEGMWRGGRDHTEGDPGRAWTDWERERVEADMPSHWATPPGPDKQTPHGPKVMLHLLLCTAQKVCTFMRELAFECVLHSRSKHVCVWKCHLLLILNKSFSSHRRNLYGNKLWQVVRAWFTVFSLRAGQQWITEQLPADRSRFSVTQD